MANRGAQIHNPPSRRRRQGSPVSPPWLRTDRRTLMEKRGEGVPIILDNSERLSGRTPEYRLIGEAELLLTIHAAGGDENGVEP